ncbi:MAG: hypothetical protein ACFN4W_10820, partial [Segatella oris]
MNSYLCRVSSDIELTGYYPHQFKIKNFWGTTENAVKIQIYSAISAYCLVAVIQHDTRLERSNPVIGIVSETTAI